MSIEKVKIDSSMTKDEMIKELSIFLKELLENPEKNKKDDKAHKTGRNPQEIINT